MKRIIYYTGLLFLLLLILNSCRQDEFVAEAQQRSEKISKFGIFSSKKEGSLARENDMHYQEGFRYLYFRYFELYPEEAPDFEDTSIPQVDFRFATQVFYEEDSTKMVFYPIVLDGKVIELLGASLNADDTYVSFFFHQDGEFKDEAIASFERQGEPDREVRGDIEEVVIPIYRPIHQQFPGYLLANFTLPGSGGCDMFGNCSGGGGDLPSPVLPQPQVTPCGKISKIGKNEKTKELMNDLKTQTGDDKEHGYVLNESNGNVDETYFHGSQGDPWIDVPMTQMDGFIHSHFNSLGLSVPSLGDIFATAYLYNNGYINNVNTFVAGVVTSGSQYLIVIDDPVKLANFANSIMNGNEINPDAYNGFETILQNPPFNINMNNNFTTNQDNFVKFLESLNTGLKLVEVSDDYTTYKTINRNSDGNVVSQNCP